MKTSCSFQAPAWVGIEPAPAVTAYSREDRANWTAMVVAPVAGYTLDLLEAEGLTVGRPPSMCKFFHLMCDVKINDKTLAFSIYCDRVETRWFIDVFPDGWDTYFDRPDAAASAQEVTALCSVIDKVLTNDSKVSDIHWWDDEALRHQERLEADSRLLTLLEQARADIVVLSPELRTRAARFICTLEAAVKKDERDHRLLETHGRGLAGLLNRANQSSARATGTALARELNIDQPGHLVSRARLTAAN